VSEKKERSNFKFAKLLEETSGRGATGFEKEMTQEGARISRNEGLPIKGQIQLPSSLLYDERGAAIANDKKRAQTAGTNSEGGYFVDTDINPFIESLKARMVLPELGAQMMGGLSANQAWPTTSAFTASWAAENGAISDSSSTVGQKTMTPKRLGVVAHISKLFMIQGNDAAIRSEFLACIAQAVESTAIKGGGSNQPAGIIDTITAAIVGGTNGAAPTWANILAFESTLGNANALQGELGFLTNYKVAAKLKGTEKASANEWVWDSRGGATPLNGYKAALTSNVPSTLTKGSSSVCSAIIFGNFNDLLIGEFGALDFTVDPYKLAEQGLVRLIINSFWDVLIKRTESFCTMEDALTA